METCRLISERREFFERDLLEMNDRVRSSVLNGAVAFIRANCYAYVRNIQTLKEMQEIDGNTSFENLFCRIAHFVEESFSVDTIVFSLFAV